MTDKNILKKIAVWVGIVLFFLVLAYAYVPQVLSGKIVNQSDITGFKSMAQESQAWDSEHPDDPSRWTDAMFGGMPNTSFMPSPKGDWTQPVNDFMFKGKRPANWRQVPGHWRSDSGYILFLQLTDYPGRPQHQDAGPSAPAMGSCGSHIHL